MIKISLLGKDLRTTPEKIMDKVNKIYREKKELNQDDTNIKVNKSYDNVLSKTGLGNTLRGTEEVINHQNKSLKESTMGTIKLPIKQMILEFTADHIRDNAGKYAAGTMLGLGAAAGYLAGDPEHGANLMGEHSPIDKVVNNVAGNHQSDFQKDLAQNVSTTNTDYHNQNKGILGNLWGGVKQGAENLKSENKFNDLTDAQREYEDIKNNDGSFLTGGQKAMLGAGVLGTGYAASKMRRR